MLSHKDGSREWKSSYQVPKGEMSFGPWIHDNRKRAVAMCSLLTIQSTPDACLREMPSREVPPGTELRLCH